MHTQTYVTHLFNMPKFHSSCVTNVKEDNSSFLPQPNVGALLILLQYWFTAARLICYSAGEPAQAVKKSRTRRRTEKREGGKEEEKEEKKKEEEVKKKKEAEKTKEEKTKEKKKEEEIEEVEK